MLDEREEEPMKKEERFDKRLVCRISRERIEEKEWVVDLAAENIGAFNLSADCSDSLND